MSAAPLRRVILVPIGLLLGFGAASCALAIGLAVTLATSPALTSRALMDVAALVLGTLQVGAAGEVMGSAMVAVWRMLITVCFVPLCLVAVVGEAVAMRSFLWCVAATAGVTSVLPVVLRTVRSDPAAAPESAALVVLLAATGCAGGAMYWLVAGRRGRSAAEIRTRDLHSAAK